MPTITENFLNIPRYPPEFAEIISKHKNFVGREFVFTAINNFLDKYDRGYFTIIGEPGIGKSAIIAHYVHQNSGIVYYNVEIPGKNNAEEFMTTICNQLLEIFQHQSSKDIADSLTNNSSTKNSVFLSLLLQQISNRLHPEQRLIITIDGCDRIYIKNQTSGSNIFYLPRYLPEKVYFILTRRPFLNDKSGLLIETPAQSLDLSAYPVENRLDVQTFISYYLNSQNINQQLFNQISNHETNFMYVRVILSSIKDEIYPENLHIYYQNHLEMMNLATNQQQTLALQVLNILVEDKSISIKTMATKLDEDEYKIKVILNKWREFLHLESRGSEIYYSIYHLSFRDWLKQQLSRNLES